MVGRIWGNFLEEFKAKLGFKRYVRVTQGKGSERKKIILHTRKDQCKDLI